MNTKIPISNKYCITIFPTGTIGFTYLGHGEGDLDMLGAGGLTMMIPPESIQPAINALERAKKLVVLK